MLNRLYIPGIGPVTCVRVCESVCVCTRACEGSEAFCISGSQAISELCFVSIEHVNREARQVMQRDETRWVSGTREWWGLWQIGVPPPSSS